MLLKSFIASANSPQNPFPLNNLPCGVFSTPTMSKRCGVAIGDFVLDLKALEALGLLGFKQNYFKSSSWNRFMKAGESLWAAYRTKLQALLKQGSVFEKQITPLLTPLSEATLHLPFKIAEYTDFYACKNHAFNVGSMFRDPENALPPNWLHLPIGYNGRASSIIVSGTPLHRPNGQLKAPTEDMPRFAPSQRFDFELEMAAIVGQPSALGKPLTIEQADKAIFGFMLLNDWSARDIQAWEYQPLGPFQSKATATTLSPWLVMKAALEPFRCTQSTREKPLLPYLHETKPSLYDIELHVGLTPQGGSETIITHTNAKELYYSFAQQLTHHSSSGCAMNVGDVLGSGTISGTTKDSRGSLLELSWGGKEPLTLKDGETRSFVQDNDTITLYGKAKGKGYTIGFGECAGQVLPAP
jgi:fumarylacetoacetase